MKALMNFFEYIKKLFKKDNNSTNLVENTKQNELQYEEKYEELYNQIEIGDIIWGKRYQNEIEKEAIPEGHREGPFVVLKKENGNLLSIEGTGVVPYKEYMYLNFYLNNEGYNLSKETYFKINKLHFINKDSFIKYMDKLQEKDKLNLFKFIKLSQKVYYTGKNEIIEFNFPIQVGDIVNYNNQCFVILDTNKKNIVCLPIKNSLDYKNKNNLEFSNFSNANYSKVCCLKLDDNVKYINAVSNICIESILKYFKEYLNNCKNMKVTQRGSLICMNNKIYYIYGEEGQEWLAFEIYKGYMEKRDIITIGNNKYYTKYEDLKISKKDNFENIYLSTEEEKDEIKQHRKKYKEAEKNMKTYGNIEGSNFKIGDIIENINYRNSRYIILNIHKKTYECLNINKIKQGIYDPILIRKIDCKLAKNTSVKGIIWLENYPSFELSKISNKEIRDLIFKTQIEYLKSKKDTLENSTSDNKNISIKTNMLVKTNEFSQETFVVKKILGDTLVCVSRADYKKQNPVKQYIKKKDVFVVEE